MLIPYQYTYLVGALLADISWIFIYFYRKDLRRELVIMSAFLTFYGVLAQYLWWTRDWWHPLTITGTRIGVEDFLLAFGNGGIASVLYSVVFRKKNLKTKKTMNLRGFVILQILGIGFIAFSTWVLHLPSAIGTNVGMALVGCIIIFLRRDLLACALGSAFLVGGIFLPVFYIAMQISPGYIEQYWIFSSLSGIRITGIPVEDILFYSLAGFVYGPFYKFWMNERLVPQK